MDNIDRAIVEYWKESTDEELASYLDITPNAVEHRRRKMGLNRVQEGVTKKKLTRQEIDALDKSDKADKVKDKEGHKQDELRARSARLGKLNELLEKSGIDLDDVEQIKSAKVNEWQAMCKGADGKPQVVDMSSSKISFTPKANPKNEPSWPVIQPATPVSVSLDSEVQEFITNLAETTYNRTDKSGVPLVQTALVFSDAHFGFRNLEGRLVPFHDDNMLKTLLKIAAEIQPDYIINLGDFLDLPEQSKYVQERSFANTTQAAIDKAHTFLAELGKVVPHAVKTYLEGNHEIRMSKYIQLNAAAAFGLKKANCPLSWPLLSIPNLLRLDELGWKYLPGWPNNEIYLARDLKLIHGHKLKLADVADKEFTSVIQGHSHRVHTEYRTRRNSDGINYPSLYAMIGCLARIDGNLPSVHGSVDASGYPMKNSENWQQGFALIHINDEHYVEHSGNHSIEQITAVNGKVIFRGKIY